MNEGDDRRWLGGGRVIPSEGYADQPYVVQTPDGAWLCVMTTAAGHEGSAGQHVVSMRSLDEGRTWIDRVDVEPASGPEASYAVLLATPGGRVYCFYNHNTDNLREVKSELGYFCTRVDSLGHYVFRYSDDGGRSWSSGRYEVPVREFACDRANAHAGKVRFFWNVGRPCVSGGVAYLTLHKVAAFGEGFFAQSEGVILRSDNILTERDAGAVRFETLPDGDVGLRAPAGGGRIAEEQCVVPLSDGTLFCVYRTVDGHPACSTSRDGGRTWAPPQYMTYSPGGRRFKHPRAANFIWRCSNGRYLYWFHNHGGCSYEGRNPAWLCAGREVDTPAGRTIEWTQPEIILYDDDPLVRMSYPDLIEVSRASRPRVAQPPSAVQNTRGVLAASGSERTLSDVGGSRFFITETQKTIARVHEIDRGLLEGLFAQWDTAQVARDGLLLELDAMARLSGGATAAPAAVPMPSLPEFCPSATRSLDIRGVDLRSGFSIELALTLDDLAAGQVILDSRSADGAGVVLATTERGTLELAIGDGRERCTWDTDPGAIQPGRPQHVVVVVDGGPKIITFVVDGVLCDGGEHRQFGWGRFSPTLASANATTPTPLAIAPAMRGAVHLLRIYGRALRTSEAVGNWRTQADRPSRA